MKNIFAFLIGITMTLAATNLSASPLNATISTDKGNIKLQLEPEKSPITVASFVNLAERGFYDGVTFHRVEPGFVIQGGDPVGNGTGGPGYRFKNEDSDLTHNREGTLAMANAGRDTNGSQFYITLSATPFLDGGYTVFGYVTEGMDVVKKIARNDKINKVVIEGDYKSLFEKEKANIDNWNAILDKQYPKKR